MQCYKKPDMDVIFTITFYERLSAFTEAENRVKFYLNGINYLFYYITKDNIGQ